MSVTNPNGANQFKLDPRQKLCLQLYMNPESETFANGYQSAQKAGYEESHAATITTQEWFQEGTRKHSLMDRAEKVLKEMLEMNDSDEITGKRDAALSRIKQDTAKFIAERIGKKDYSTRSEQDITSNGEPLKIVISEAIAKKNGLE